MLTIKRHKTREIQLGPYTLGKDHPIRIQSMTNTDTRNIQETLKQIHQLHAAGCEIVRLAVPDIKAGNALKEIAKKSPVPLVADIHFDYRLALMALDAGFPALRINPGNILNNKKQQDKKPLDILANAIKEHNACIRIGVNSGSLEKNLWEKYGHPCPEALVESALNHTKFMEERGITNIKVSLKSSSVLDTIEAYTLMAQKSNYPLHLGVTEAGTLVKGAVKSAIGIGYLLMQGIGDTLRVSLTANPVEEIAVAQDILRATGHRHIGAEIISCPTCGRTEIDLLHIANTVEKHVQGQQKNIKIAIMGCVVNGPGEAREADIGLAAGRNKGVIFKKGEIIHSINGEDALLKTFIAEIDTMLM